MISRRARRERQENALNRAFDAAGRRNQSVLDLTGANPTLAELRYPSERIADIWQSAWQGTYRVESLGDRRTRELLVDSWYRQRTATDDGDAGRTALTASTSEAYSFLLKLFCDPADEILVPEPSYPLLQELAAYEGVKAVPYQLDHGSWELDTDSVRRAKSKRTRAVLAVSPNNPTGSVLTRKEWQCLAELGVAIISDEVFSCYGKQNAAGHGGETFSALCCDLDVPVITLDGLSKRALLPQAKAAWLYLNGDDKVTGALMSQLELIADTFLSVSPHAQKAMPALLNVTAEVREQVAKRLRKNLDLLDAQLQGSPVSRYSYSAGWYIILRLPAVMDEDEWAIKFLREAQLKVQPGWFYDIEHGPNIVISLLTHEPLFEVGLERLIHCVKE